VVGPLGIEKKNNLEKSELPYFSIERLKDRSDFLKIAKGKVVHKKGFVLQGRKRFGSLQDIRVGFTCSKKVGNAVLRNLAKRRLREIARDILPKNGSNGWDYVLIGRKDLTAELNLNFMAKELKEAVNQLNSIT
tara:strand:+ start:376 stop:777 length:402 start_codon:yes stop_codon:yes gene_type:complete